MAFVLKGVEVNVGPALVGTNPPPRLPPKQFMDPESKIVLGVSAESSWY